MTDCIDAIHQFWFGGLDDTGMCAVDQHSLWFTPNPDTDAHCRTHFGHWLDLALTGELNHWTETDRGLVALVVNTENGQLRSFTQYARAHRDVIALCGRFPHRNAMLGRLSSSAEIAHLKKHKGF